MDIYLMYDFMDIIIWVTQASEFVDLQEIYMSKEATARWRERNKEHIKKYNKEYKDKYLKDCPISKASKSEYYFKRKEATCQNVGAQKNQVAAVRRWNIWQYIKTHPIEEGFAKNVEGRI